MPVGSINGDDVRTGLGQCGNMLKKRCDPNWAFWQVNFDNPYDWRIRDCADCNKICDPLYPQAHGPPVKRRKSKGRHYLGLVHRTTGHWLTGNNQAAAQSVQRHSKAPRSKISISR